MAEAKQEIAVPRWTVIPGNHLGDRIIYAATAEDAIKAYERTQGVELPRQGWEETGKDGVFVLKHIPHTPPPPKE